MKTSTLRLAGLLFACALLAACASPGKHAAGNASEVQVYGTTQLTPLQYTVVQHIWTDEWRSNVSIPTFGSADDGVQALKEKAAAVGATGLLHVMCEDAAGYSNGRLLCYADAIRFN
jgi:hypothetical protein